MTTAVKKRKATPIDRLKRTLNADSVQEQFKNALADNAPLFVASLIDLYGTDEHLQKCNPNEVIIEALKAATLRLPINKNLGFAHLIAFKIKGKATPQMIIGYKGLIQLAMRTGQYRYLNADVVYEGELKSWNKLTGEMDLSGERTGDKVLGYFAYLELLNGFSKVVYWTREDVLEHGKRYSPSYSSKYSPWQTDFDSMALKTVLRNLISKWGIMSVEMAGAIDGDIEAETMMDIENHANKETLSMEDVIDIAAEEGEPDPEHEQPKDEEEGLVLQASGPGF